MSTEPEVPRLAHAHWPAGTSTVPPSIVNQYVIQFVPGPANRPEAVVISFGFVSLPILEGTPDEIAVQMAHLREVDIAHIAKLAMTPERLLEFAGLVQEAVQRLMAFSDVQSDGEGTVEADGDHDH